MSRDNKILLAALAGGSVLVPAVLGLALSAAANAPLADVGYGVFRM